MLYGLLHATHSAVRVRRAGRGVYNCCFKGKVRGAGQGSATVAEMALTTHAWLLLPDNCLTGCKATELKSVPSFHLIHHRPLQCLSSHCVMWHPDGTGLVGVTTRCADHSLVLWAAADTASGWVQRCPSSCSKHPAVGRGHKVGLQTQESRQGSHGEVLPPCSVLLG